jgi:hypothetical protein
MGAIPKISLTTDFGKAPEQNNEHRVNYEHISISIMNKFFLICNSKLKQASVLTKVFSKTINNFRKLRNDIFYINARKYTAFQELPLRKREALAVSKNGLSVIEVHQLINKLNNRKRYNYENDY